MRYIIIISILFLASCGGGGGSSTPPTRTSGTFEGVAHDAPLRNVRIRVFDWSTGNKGDLLGETTTDAQGNYTLDITSPDKPIMITAGDTGSYTEEASGRSISLQDGQNISAITNYQSGETLSLQVTPFTHLARCYAEHLIDDGESVADALNLSNSKMAAIAGVEIIQTAPLDVTDINNSTVDLSPGLKYGFLTAGISEAMVVASTANGQSAHSQSFLTSIHWSKIACNDIRNDGLLNGFGYIDDSTISTLTFGTYAINPYFYRNILAQGILAFTKSNNNATGLDVSKLLTFANALSTNTDSVWNGEAPEGVDTDGPTVTPGLVADSYIGGVATLPFTIEDPIGVDTIEFYLNNALLATQGASSPNLSFDTTTYLDGAYVVKIVASDIVGNETTYSITYNIQNTGPAINMTTPSVVGESSYTAAGTWVSSGANITSISVNSVAATINGDGTWSADLTLISGSNTIAITANDDIGNQTIVSYTVGLDMNDPLITVLNRDVRQTTYQGQYNLCNSVSFGTNSTDPICIRSDRVSLNGASIPSILGSQEYMYLRFDVEDTLGAGVYSQFEDLDVEYKYAVNGTEVIAWTILNTGSKSSIPGSLDGYYVLPITTEYLGSDWFNTSISDTHVVTVKVTDSVGNYSEQIYTMQFDVLLYGVSAAFSTDGGTVLNLPFESRFSADGSTVTVTSTINNDSDNAIYFNHSVGSNHNVTQVYEAAVRKNLVARWRKTHWGVVLPNGDWTDLTANVTEYSGGVAPIDSTTTDLAVPGDESLGTEYISTDVLPSISDSDPEYITEWHSACYAGSPDITVSTGWGQATGGFTHYLDYTSSYIKSDGYPASAYGCSITVYDNGSPTQTREDIKRYYSYWFEQEEGYPKTNVSTHTLNHDITNISMTVTNVNTGNLAASSNGYFIVPPGEVVEVKKLITLPLLPDFADAQVANPDTFSSYEQAELDVSIGWDIDETITLNLYAAIGSSANVQNLGGIENYSITRN